MEKATIELFGKGWKLTFENNKTMIINWPNVPKDWDKAIIDVKRMKGQPIQLINGKSIINKKEYASSNPKGGEKNETPMNAKKNVSAKAPYNFVPLNEQVVYPEDQNVFFDRYDPERNTGIIDLEIVNLTPLFIKGNGGNFLTINDKPIIPGSSMRGLIRSLVELLSYSKLSFINDSKLYYRSFADHALRLRTEYNNAITSQTEVGILFKTKEKNYILVPSRLLGTINDTSKDNTCTYDESKNEWKLYSGKMPGGQTAKRKNYLIEGQKIDNANGISILRNSTIIKDYKNDATRKGLDVLAKLESKKLYKSNGIPIFYQSDSSGNITSFGNTLKYRLPYIKSIKDHLYLAHKETSDKLDISNLIFGFLPDKKSENPGKATRVFFEDLPCCNPEFESEKVLQILSNPKPTSFQLYLEQPKGINTPKKDIRHWNDDSVIRGYKHYWHRVTPSDGSNGSYQVRSFSIRESDFRNFLTNVIKHHQPEMFINELYNDTNVTKNVDGRGNSKITFKGDISLLKNDHKQIIKKLFFLDNKIAKTHRISSMQNTMVNPLKSNNRFVGILRFENLTNIELGALLSALSLPNDCAHKMGMGKPLGLGTIQIKAKLKLDNRDFRYKNLVDENGKWVLNRNNKGEDDFKKDFEHYVLKQIGSSNSNLWEEPRIQSLKKLLQFNSLSCSSSSWINKTRYMDLKEFRERDVLDNPLTYFDTTN
jgi:hypothetical protein